MNEVGVEIVKTEEADENGIKCLNINVSNSEVERNPDIVRLCADVGFLEYVKPKMGHWIIYDVHGHKACKCSECGIDDGYPCNDKYCPNCGASMVEPQESEDKE